MNSRSTNARRLLMAPVWLVGLGLAMVYMLATAPVIALAAFALLIPAELLWLASAFVGVASPAAGHRLASIMEPAVDGVTNVIDFVWKPLALVIG